MGERDMWKKRFFMGLLLAILLVGASTVMAGEATNWLKNDVTYSADLNHDGKAELVRLKTLKSGYIVTGQLVVDGKEIYKLPMPTASMYCKWRIITLSNGRRFILGYTEGPNPGISRTVLLEYTAKKKVKLHADLSTVFTNYATAQMFSRVEVPGNNIVLVCSNMTWTCGPVSMNVTYKYQSGKLKRSYKGEINTTRQFTAAKAFQSYKKYQSSKKAFVVRSGEKVTFVAYYQKGKQFWMQLKNASGKKGWMKGLTYQKGGKSPLFTDGWYAN